MSEKLPIMAVLDTDTFNEVDDQFTLAYALLATEAIDLRAVIAAPFMCSSTSWEQQLQAP